MHQRVTIYGPNIGRGGEFHVHRAGCADTKRGEYLRTDPPWSLDAASHQQVVEDVYSDILPENPGATWETYEETVRFFPCIDIPRRICGRCGAGTSGFAVAPDGISIVPGGAVCRTCASVLAVPARLAYARSHR